MSLTSVTESPPALRRGGVGFEATHGVSNFNPSPVLLPNAIALGRRTGEGGRASRSWESAPPRRKAGGATCWQDGKY